MYKWEPVRVAAFVHCPWTEHSEFRRCARYVKKSILEPLLLRRIYSQLILIYHKIIIPNGNMLNSNVLLDKATKRSSLFHNNRFNSKMDWLVEFGIWPNSFTQFLLDHGLSLWKLGGTYLTSHWVRIHCKRDKQKIHQIYLFRGEFPNSLKAVTIDNLEIQMPKGVAIEVYLGTCSCQNRWAEHGLCAISMCCARCVSPIIVDSEQPSVYEWPVLPSNRTWSMQPEAENTRKNKELNETVTKRARPIEIPILNKILRISTDKNLYDDK